ncbi:MAG: sugar transferase [Planctomycetota bacterium]
MAVTAGALVLWITFIEQTDQWPIRRLLGPAAAMAGLWVLSIALHGGYDLGLRGVVSPVVRARMLLFSGLYSTGGLMILSFLLGFALPPLGGLAMALIVGACTMACMRLGMRRLGRWLAANDVLAHRVVIGGTGREARAIAARLRTLSGSMKVVAFFCPDKPAASSFMGRPVLCGAEELDQWHSKKPFHTFVASSHIWGTRLRAGTPESMQLINFCEARGIETYVVADLYDISVTSREVATFSEVPLIQLRDAAAHPVYSCCKRIVDICLSSVLLVAMAPLMAAIALAVKLTSPGPVLFKQVRAGQHGRAFRMLKFRTMFADAEDRLSDLVDFEQLKEPVFKLRNDPRVTGVGRFLRRTGLDELPQLWNILRGDMAMIGPRPEELSIVRLYNDHQRRRLKVKPGLTGLQQVECRGNTSLSRRIALDLVYMKHQGPVLDAYILFKTVLVVLRGTETTG